MTWAMRTVAVACAVLAWRSARAAPVAAAQEDPLYVGWASVDITPDRPVAVIGHFNKRIARRARDPLTATALAIETRGENGGREAAIMISCDVLWIQKSMQDRLRQRLKSELAEFDVRKLFLNATHTHTAPGFEDETFGKAYDVSNDPGVMKASEYGEFFVGRLAKAAVEAWKGRKPAGMSWGLSQAVVGTNRRAHYFDGTSVMYGKTDRADFSHVEGGSDQGVELLFFWDDAGKLTGVLVNLACTSQETEGLSEISADFWHEVRLELRKRHSQDLFIFPQCSAAGDQSPHLLFRDRADKIMLQRRGLSRRQEIARRIANAVDDALAAAKSDIRTKLIFRHTVAQIDLPEKTPPAESFYKTDPVRPIEVHALRLGEIAMATNPFELYLDYGVRIKARSQATLTLVVQLSCQHCGYLPTQRGVEGGVYSADKYVVGPEGGQVLVNETVRRIDELWK